VLCRCLVLSQTVDVLERLEVPGLRVHERGRVAASAQGDQSLGTQRQLHDHPQVGPAQGVEVLQDHPADAVVRLHVVTVHSVHLQQVSVAGQNRVGETPDGSGNIRLTVIRRVNAQARVRQVDDIGNAAVELVAANQTRQPAQALVLVGGSATAGLGEAAGAHEVSLGLRKPKQTQHISEVHAGLPVNGNVLRAQERLPVVLRHDGSGVQGGQSR